MEGKRFRFAGPVLVLALVLVASVTAGPASSRAEAGTTTGQVAETAAKVDLNRASAEELQAVPGIGVALAERIVRFREEHGPFERVEDVLKVRGIGEKSFQKMRPYLTVSSPKR